MKDQRPRVQFRGRVGTLRVDKSSPLVKFSFQKGNNKKKSKKRKTEKDTLERRRVSPTARRLETRAKPRHRLIYIERRQSNRWELAYWQFVE